MAAQLQNPFTRSPSPSSSAFYPKPPAPRHPSCLSKADGNVFGSRGGVPVVSSGNGGSSSRTFQFRVSGERILDPRQRSPVHPEIKIFDGDASNLFHVQTLRNFPMEKLKGEVVAVRFDSTLLLNASHVKDGSMNKALDTIKFLYDAGAKVLLLSNWGHSNDLILISTESFAEYLSSILQLKVVPANAVSYFGNLKEMKEVDILLFENLSKFKGERANCLDFSKKLSAGVGIFVNDDFSLAHKVLASTVGISRSCYSSVAGFHFEEELHQLASVTEITKRPYIAIIGGGKFLEKRTVVHTLAMKCDGLMFVGIMAFQIMHALGLSVPMNLVEYDAVKEVLELVQLAKDKNVELFFPDDFWCVNNRHPGMMDIFPNNRILPGWVPIDLGPVSLENIFSWLLKCKKVLLIGPMSIKPSEHDFHGASNLDIIIEKISQIGCEVVVVGNTSYKTFVGKRKGPDSFFSYKHFKNSSVVWEFLKGHTLPGTAALDRAYPFDLDWDAIFSDPSQPLVVDIGSGNGLFLLQMARRWQKSNFLGLEINRKLVARCLNDILQFNTKNVYFLSTNATSTFRSIVSSYPGRLVLVTIQCPNPDFNKTEHRWKMVRRMLVEEIVDLLSTEGKVILQSDIEEVARRMSEDFMRYGKGKLALDGDDGGGWIMENPFGVRSDWEQHFLDRGAPMYRVMIRKWKWAELSDASALTSIKGSSSNPGALLVYNGPDKPLYGLNRAKKMASPPLPLRLPVASSLPLRGSTSANQRQLRLSSSVTPGRREAAVEVFKKWAADSKPKVVKLLLSGAVAVGVALSGLGYAEAKVGVNKPELLPKEYTPVIDVAGFLSTGQENRLIEEITDLEKDTGFKLRILVQNFPHTPGLAIRDFWNVDDRTIVFVADPTFGNILHFNVGESVDLDIPRNFWTRLAGKYGNMFYWKEKGEDRSIEDAVKAISSCLREPVGPNSCSEVL